jgi:hypothetical protein
MRGFSTDPVLLVDDDDLMRAALGYRETVTRRPPSTRPHARPSRTYDRGRDGHRPPARM